MAVIEFKGVTVSYGVGLFRRRRAVNGLNASLTPGLVWGITGPNGAGKSTLLRLCLGLQSVTSGTVLVDGDSPRAFVEREGIAFVPDEPRLPGSWTPRSLLARVADLAGLVGTRREDAIADALDRWGLAPFARTTIRKLSKGTAQRAMLAQGFLAPSRVVILDEPSNALDLVWRARLQHEIRRLRASNRIIVFASHDLSELSRSADRVIVLERGAVLGIIDARPTSPGDSARGYRLRLANVGSISVNDVFSGASAAGPSEYTIADVSVLDLRRGLLTLMSAGAAIEAVAPLGDALEDAVRSLLLERGAAGE